MSRKSSYIIAILHPSRSALGRLLDRLTDGAIKRRTKLRIRSNLSVEQFFQSLDERNIRYVVLRWFQDLPVVAPNHDIDILIEDAAVGKFEDLLGLWPRLQRIDVYTASGSGRFMYNAYTPDEVPVFPPEIAEMILSDAVRHNGIRVPSKLHRFLCLAYHVVYFKSLHSGLPSRYGDLPSGRVPSHDYAKAFRELSHEAGIEISPVPSLEELDRVLADHEWRPPLETLERNAKWSPWVARHFFSQDGIEDAAQGSRI